MGMFDDAAKKLASDAAARAGGDVQQQNALGTLAQEVAHDLNIYMANHPRGEDIDLGILKNEVTLSGRTSGRVLEITCAGAEAFHLREGNGGFHREVRSEPPRPISTREAITKDEMTKRVVGWLQERRA
jgi:hypothetical protein